MAALVNDKVIEAMKSIKEDFVPNTKSNGWIHDNRLYTINEKAFEEYLKLSAEQFSSEYEPKKKD